MQRSRKLNQSLLYQEIYAKTFQAGILPAVAGYWPSDLIGDHPIAGGVKPEEFDAFHELILVDELSRSASGGVLWAMLGGLSIGNTIRLYFVIVLYLGFLLFSLCINRPSSRTPFRST